MIKELISALRGSNKTRKDVVTRLVVNGDVYTDSDEVKVQQNDRTFEPSRSMARRCTSTRR